MSTYQTIELGGKLRPIRFSYATLYEYEKDTGRNAITDFQQISVSIIADLAFSGLAIAAKSKGLPVDFTAVDVAEWVFGEEGAVEKIKTLFVDSFAKTGAAPEDGDDEKKPKKSQPGTK